MRPNIHPSCFVHEIAVIIGDVEIGAGCGIWPHAGVREEMKVPVGSLVVGVPGKVIREEDGGLRAAILQNARTYQMLRDRHKERAFEQYKVPKG